LLIDYIYVSENERNYLLNNSLDYVIDIHNEEEYKISNNNFEIQLNKNFMCKNIYIVPRLDNYYNGYFKEKFNFSLILNW